MSTPTLRGIAKSYADGQIDRRTCILERRRLIDGIVSGELELVPYRPPAPEPPPVVEKDDGDDTLEIALSDIERSPRRTVIWVIAAIVILGVIAAALGVYLQRPALVTAEPGIPAVIPKPEPAATQTPFQGPVR